MFDNACTAGNFPGQINFNIMLLTIGETERVTVKTLFFSNREKAGPIKSARK